jgi:ATP-dependent Lhr-like helicase
MIKNREGYHLFMYPFEGRLVHEVMAALIAYRISKLAPISFSMAMNDYGFELFSDKEIPLNEENLHKILTRDQLMQDVIASINSAEMARRKFRDIAVISGMVIQNYAGKQRSNKSYKAQQDLFLKYWKTMTLIIFLSNRLILKSLICSFRNRDLWKHLKD